LPTAVQDEECDVANITTNVFESDDDTPAVSLIAGEPLILAQQAAIFAAGNGFGADAIVAAGSNVMTIAGSVFSRSGSAIESAAGGHTITIAASATLYAYAVGISLGAGDNTVTNGGQINASNSVAVVLNGGSSAFTNNGSIRSGASSGVVMSGAGNTFTNNGHIEAAGSFVAATVQGNITNHGTILGGFGVALSADAGTVTNTGSIITTTGGAVGGTGFADTVNNSGLLQSPGPATVFLAGGGDSYLGAGGQVVGEVWGGDGNDSLVGGAFTDLFRGNADNDTLNGGGGADFLDGGAGNDRYELGADTSDSIGDASGIDTVTSTIARTLTWGFIENLILEGGAAINGTGNALGNSIVGNGAANTLAGQAGNDVLVGGGGNDFLYGQADKDSLTGGAGNDRFVVQTVAHTATGMGDVIVDLDDNGDDIIDLTGIIPGVLTFIGGAAFSGANQVRYQQVGANVLVEINTAGSTAAEGQNTHLNTTNGNAALGQVNAADFLL
jgi:Ca2+-binding RTX toxin-like protein